MRRLNGMDAMLLYSETPNLHNHTLKVAVVDVSDHQEFGFEDFRRILASRLHLLDPLRFVLIDIPFRVHHPMWLENCDVDLDYHLRRVEVPSPGGRRELDDLIGRIASAPLDRRRPLWEFYFAEGLADHRVALIGKLHHALADGVASANLLARLMDSDVVEPNCSDLSCLSPTKRELLQAAGRDHLRLIAELPEVAATAVSGYRRMRHRAHQRDEPPDLARTLHAPRTFLNHIVSPTRTFASCTLPVSHVKNCAKLLQITINDLVMATAAGALRRLLLRYDNGADQPLVASVLASTDKSSQRIAGNQLSGMPVSLPVHIDDPLERVRLAKTSTTIAKENYELLGPDLFGRLVTYLPPPAAPPAFRWVAKRQSRNRLFNLPISNVTGPRKRGRFGGCPVTEIYSVGPLPPGCGVNITVWSYVHQLNISIIADDITVRDTHEITDAMSDAYAEICHAVGLLDVVPPADDAMAPARASW
ncbi:wax ester/triacylglycerol synthase family O-acyltransferase [Mycobacterium sp. EPa45]|uniref:WS/DGAT/MGAT family O-acyltransferase n=1 Tax=Mycobacterium sp. EPa45 TaxID=1545728 RepID=UPI0006419C8D|nr:wax ester/triacylglycerol synthase family O-acyltransferase [Mycobacterium sp. EPa45]AKK29383.1 diacylglycerol O-acyltransferase [Mycobacterium sp. EPa45]